MAEQKLCTVCGTVGNTKRDMKGSIFTEFLLWCFFLLPGLIYSIWRHSTVAQVCRNCGSPAVIPLSSPVAQQTLVGRGTTASPSAIKEMTATTQTYQLSDRRLLKMWKKTGRRRSVARCPNDLLGFLAAQLMQRLLQAVKWMQMWAVGQIEIPVITGCPVHTVMMVRLADK